MDISILLQAVLGLIAFIFVYKSGQCIRRKGNSGWPEPPEVGGRRPITGHLHLFWRGQPMMRLLGDLADTYGPAFTIWVGIHRTVVVSSWELARECFTVNDRALAGRPKTTVGKYLADNSTMFAISPCGPHWRESRKMAAAHLLSPHQVELFQSARAAEAEVGIREIRGSCAESENGVLKLDVGKWFAEQTFNGVVMMVAGKRYFGPTVAGDEAASRAQEAIRRVMYFSGRFFLSDAIPFVEWLDVGGHIAEMKETITGLHSLIDSWIDEHRAKKKSPPEAENREKQDFIDGLLSDMEKSPKSDSDARAFMRQIILAIIIAGTDTTHNTLTWALSLLLNNDQALQKVRDELDAQIGSEREPNESDLEKLPYLQAVVKETLRLYPPGPITMPHEATEDCTVGGFRVPAGSRVSVNLWKLQRDPSVWEEPTEFRPERFLTTHADVDGCSGQHFQYIPFGSGRRMCPGGLLALQMVQFTLARLLQAFEVSRPTEEQIDMSEGLGLTLPKTGPLEVLVTPR